MPSLRETQLGFAEAIVHEGAAPRFGPRLRGRGLGGARRIQVYRNNLFNTLAEALAAVYPVIRCLVGEVFFRLAAREYIRTHPSQSGDIHRFGDRFREFLPTLSGSAAYPYLADVAALEWAYHEVFHAEPRAAMDLERLRAVSPDRFPLLRFRLLPAARLLASDYPVLRIWQVNETAWRGDQSVSLDEGGCRLLVIRVGDGIEIQALSGGEFAWLSALADNTPLADALQQALEVEAAFDLQAALRRHVAQATLVGWWLPPGL